jgi:serine/threonine-protein kinase RIO1
LFIADVLELDEEDSEADDEVYQDDYIECSFFHKIKDHMSKQSTKCQDTKQRKRGRDRTRSQSDIDSETRMTLYKFMKKSVLKDHYGIVNKGKKSLILHAQGGM